MSLGHYIFYRTKEVEQHENLPISTRSYWQNPYRKTS